MTPEMLEPLIPIVAIIFIFGMPVAFVFLKRYFAFKERELQLEQEAQRWAERNYTALEQRVQRLESALLSFDEQVRARVPEAAQRFASIQADSPPALPEGAPAGERAAPPPVQAQPVKTR